jgi:hypothetical protein
VSGLFSSPRAEADRLCPATVLQFRHRDFDMEKCVLSVTIPAPAEGFDPAVHISNGSRVDIYQLTPDAEELLPSISWGTAPARHRKLLTVDFDTATNVTSRPYHCPRGLFSTFELECVGAPCMVDFWQTRHWKSGMFTSLWRTSPSANVLTSQVLSSFSTRPMATTLLIWTELCTSLPHL